MLKKILKAIIPRNLRHKLSVSVWKFRDEFRLLFTENSFLVNVYYAVFSSEFNREHNATIYGIKKKRNEKTDRYLVRRNIHRIEKGLTMRPRRAVFGEGFITETFNEFMKIDLDDDDQYYWYRDVLGEYFEVTGHSDTITPLRKRFVEKFNTHEQTNLKPYKRKNSLFSSITYDEILTLSKKRRSVRWYEERKVPRELIEKALKVGLYAPSACNRQPFEFLVFDDPEKIKRISSLPMGTAGFSHQIQMLIVVVGDLSAYDSERDRHVIYIDGSLCTMGFILALETLGLSSCLLNWPDIEPLELKMDKELNLPLYKRPLFLISVGYADPEGLIPYSMKKSVNEIVKYNNEKK